MAQMTPAQMEDLKEQMRGYVDKHIKENPDDLNAISQMTGYHVSAILEAIADKSANFNTIADIYAAHRRVEVDKISYIKSHLTVGSADIFKISEQCNMKPHNIMTKINSGTATPEEIDDIYKATRALLTERSHDMLAKNAQTK